MRYLSLSTQIEETISYKYPIVICNKGRRYFAIRLCFWCSHLEFSDYCLNVSLFCGFIHEIVIEPKVYCDISGCAIF